MRTRYFILRRALLAAAIAAIAVPNNTFASTIGLYTDESGSVCSFAGNAPGVVTAYLIIQPDAQGIRSVQFSAPVPACMGATHLYDIVPDGVTSSGSSPTGMSISYPFCASEQALALTINYYRSGSTDPCCAFSVGAHPLVGFLEGTDCSFNPATMVPLISHFNADASCPCGTPPPVPSTPVPPHNTTGVSVFTGLSWQPLETEFAIADFDVYFGTDPVPPLVATVTESTYQPPAPLAAFTQYYWRIIVRDTIGFEVPGPTWTFTTRAFNTPPTVPAYLAPANGATGVPVGVSLQWISSDIDGDPIEYDVYFGTAADPPLVASDLTATSYSLPPLAYVTTYFWRVVARDFDGSESSGAVATFTTRGENQPPFPAANPVPADQATMIGESTLLDWTSNGDPDVGDTVSFDLYFGTSATPPLYASNSAVTYAYVAPLVPGTDYYWQVVTRDNHGATTPGPVWTFRTNAPPVLSSPSPATGATGVAPIPPLLAWQGSDPDGQPVTYDIFWALTSPPTLKASNLTNPYYQILGGVTYQQTVYWQVRARDNLGLTTMGPIWSFVTATNTPPTQASNPIPADNGYSGSETMLRWDPATDAETAVRYIVYFGTVNPPPYGVVTVETQYDPGPLEDDVWYYWQVDVSDGTLVTTGQLWSFTGGDLPAAVAPAPNELALGLNHPNPFNPQTIIPYGVPTGSNERVRLTIYDAAGKLVRRLVDEHQNPGWRDAVWRGDDDRGARVSSGIYYCVLQMGNERRTRKLVLLK